MCVERCNYHVAFPEFISALRCEACADGYKVKCSHGGTLQSLMHMMARRNLQQDRLGWLSNDIQVSDDCDTLFFVGCAPYFDVIFSDLGVATIKGVKGALRLLNLARIPFKLLQNERCCGHDLLNQGDREGFLALARINMEEFSRNGIKRIITHCPEGNHTFKVDYPKMLGDTGIEVLHLTEILTPLIKKGELSFGRLEKKITFHDPCLLGRCARLFDEPRTVLGAVPGLKLVEMEQNRETALCCGSSPWAQCGSVNQQIQKQRLIQAEATEADLLVTACPKCQIHLKCSQKTGGDKVPQIDIQDLAHVLHDCIDERR
jgi:Fe-S oxidoreductase